MNCGPPDQLPPSFLNLNWEQANPNLVGQLGSLSNAEMISPQSQYIVNPMNSPPNLNLSMMGHLHHHHHHQQTQPQGLMPISENPMPATQLDQLWPDPGFVERAAKFSSFDGRNYPEFASNSSLRLSRPQVEFLDCGNVTQLHGGPQPGMSNAEFGNAQEESSVSDTVSHAGEVNLRGPFMKNTRKRKVAGKGKGKETSFADSTKESFKVLDEKYLDAKRCRSEESNGTEKDVIKPKLEQNASVSANEDGDQKQCKDNNSKLPEPPKDYIHVRARRGQATDSHSLAERVRREKISQRMKLLQDLVPGCNKVTGKAVMLDEIINYVQSLQRQVEFLSMKLATVNPQLDFSNLPNLFPKDMHQSCNPLLESVFPLETSGAAFSYGNQPQQGNPLHSVVTSGMESQCSMNPLDSTICQTINTHPLFHNGISDGASHQLGNFWDNDL